MRERVWRARRRREGTRVTTVTRVTTDHDDHDDHGHGGSGAELDMDLTTNTIDIALTMPQSDNFNMILGSNILSQENKNFGFEELIPDADMNDFGVYGLDKLQWKMVQL